MARRLDSSKAVVVILPDTGRSYLGKIYSDEWMQEQGFLKAGEKRMPVDAVLRAKPKALRDVLGVGPKDTLSKAIGLMKRHDISQLPVLVGGVQVGSVSSASLLKRDVAIRSPNRLRVEDVMEEPLPSVEKGSSILNPRRLFKDGNAVVVIDGPRVVGVISTIDVINYLAKR